MMNAVENLRSLLAKNIVRFTYQKVDGTIRHAVGTRNLDIARAKTGEDIPAPRFGEQPYSYYDVEKKGWRSYKPELLISIDGVTPVEYVDLRETPTAKREIPVEMPSHTESFPMSEIFKGLFGGVGFGGGFVPKYHDEEPVKESVGVPVGAVPVEDFAKLVAHYVVEELVERITR